MARGAAAKQAKKPAKKKVEADKAVTATAASPLGSMAESAATQFAEALRAWYRKHARVLPWRGVDDPYATWVSEIMLQQTRVATVVERYAEFLLRFPTLAALASAEEAEVLALWSGLGYYRRARMLHRGAQFVERELGGRLPRTEAELRTLPGIGEYTAAAIASIAFGEPVAVVDGNVERVLLRVLGETTMAHAALVRAAQALMQLARRSKRNANPAGEHNQAMMELGATICLPRSPLCLQCPVVEMCRTRGEHPARPRPRMQSRRVAHLLAVRKRGVRTQVLLARRPQEASLMPGMLELPALPLEAVAGREPVLRLRHAITNTNYVVEVFAEGAPGIAPEREPAHLLEDVPEDERVFEMPSEPEPAGRGGSLQQAVSASAADLEWVESERLWLLPLTGLARKALQRLGVMRVEAVTLG